MPADTGRAVEQGGRPGGEILGLIQAARALVEPFAGLARRVRPGPFGFPGQSDLNPAFDLLLGGSAKSVEPLVHGPRDVVAPAPIELLLQVFNLKLPSGVDLLAGQIALGAKEILRGLLMRRIVHWGNGLVGRFGHVSLRV